MRSIGLRLSPEGYRRLFLKNINQCLRSKIKNAEKLKEIKDFKKDHFGHYYGRAKLFPFAKKLIAPLARRAPLGIVSSTRKIHIQKTLSRHGLAQCFGIILGSEAETKERGLVRAVKSLKGSLAESFFVTDTAGDIAAGKALGMKALAVGWGFHPAGRLKKSRPHGFFGNPGALIRFLLF